MTFSSNVTSPDVFRKWGAITAVGASLERRVWADVGEGALYPNMYVLLVATPGVGKGQTINTIERLVRETREFKVAPNDVSKASLVDAIAASGRSLTPATIPGLPQAYDYSSLFAIAEEFGVFFPIYDQPFMNVLNSIYTNPDNFQETKRHLAKPVDITRPQLNILAGTQPAFLSATFPDEAWSTGFTARLLMVYSATQPDKELFTRIAPDLELRKDLVKRLKDNLSVYGEMKWSPEAIHVLREWKSMKYAPVPEHSRMQHYVTRRLQHCIKLCTISALSRAKSFTIEGCDVLRARHWLLEVEELMPDIFREMVQKSDTQVINELHSFMWQIYAKTRGPVHERRIFNFMRSRLPADKIYRVLELACRSGVMKQMPEVSSYMPKPKSEHGLE